MDLSSVTSILKGFTDNNQLTLQIGNIISKVNTIDFTKINSLGNFINEYTKSNLFSLVDTNSVSSLISNILKEGSSLGVKGLFQALSSGLGNDILAKVINGSIGDLIKNNDLISLLDMVNSVFGKSMHLIYPNLLNDLAKAFNKTLTNSGTNADYATILEIFSKANVNWDVFIHENGNSWQPLTYSVDTGMSIVSILEASEPFKKTILNGIKNETEHHRRKMYGLATVYKKTTVLSEIKQRFPKVAIPVVNKVSTLNTSTNNQNTVDPRVLVNLSFLNNQNIF
jgi:hypothetical protein